MTGDSPLVAGVELGGTKSIAVIARGREIVDEARWPTTTPDATLNAIADWIATSNICRGISSFIFSQRSRPRRSACDRCVMMLSASTLSPLISVSTRTNGPPWKRRKW